MKRDYDYWFFAGNHERSSLRSILPAIYQKYDAVSTYRRKENSAEFIEELFKNAGMTQHMFPIRNCRNNRELYLPTA